MKKGHVFFLCIRWQFRHCVQQCVRVFFLVVYETFIESHKKIHITIESFIFFFFFFCNHIVFAIGICTRKKNVVYKNDVCTRAHTLNSWIFVHSTLLIWRGFIYVIRVSQIFVCMKHLVVLNGFAMLEHFKDIPPAKFPAVYSDSVKCVRGARGCAKVSEFYFVSQQSAKYIYWFNIQHIVFTWIEYITHGLYCGGDGVSFYLWNRAYMWSWHFPLAGYTRARASIDTAGSCLEFFSIA